MIERFLPKSCKIVLLPISEKTVASGSSNTLAQEYAASGTKAVTKSLEEMLDIKFDGFIVLDHTNFENVIYYIDEDSDDVLNYEQGEELTLFGSEMRLFLTYPNYANGAGQNQKVFGEMLSKVVNQGLSTALTVQNLSSTYSAMVKGATDKNFSLNDFDERMTSNIKYIIDNSDEPAQYITATGSWDLEGTKFTLDNEFKNQLKELFEL